ncbi:MAG: MnhB domain-containing protein [Akkermansiaceae bacterium]
MSYLNNSMLPAAARLVIPVQYLFAIYLLLRGHNLPGGGFIGGLVLASALVLRVMVDPSRAPKRDLIALAGVGLLVALASASLPLAFGQPFFSGMWAGQIWLPTIGKMKIGTPLFFDIGVFLVVTGVGAKMLLVLLIQHQRAQMDRLRKRSPN